MSPRREGNSDIRRGRSVVHSLHAHLVFTPKYRRGPFTGEILARCEEIVRDVCADFGAELREFNGEPDHVRLLVHYPPKIALSRLAGSLKGVSARRLRQESPAHTRRHLRGEHFRSRPTSPHPAAARHPRSSRTTSSNRTARHNPTRLLPGPKARGSSHHNAGEDHRGVAAMEICTRPPSTTDLPGGFTHEYHC
jgi:putative transposase